MVARASSLLLLGLLGLLAGCVDERVHRLPDGAGGGAGSGPTSTGGTLGLGNSAFFGRGAELRTGGPNYGSDCPAGAAPTVPAKSPRVLVIGPSGKPFSGFIPAFSDVPNAKAIATHLQGMLSADSAFDHPFVAEIDSDVFPVDPTLFGLGGGVSLMNFYYLPADRAARLALLSEPWSYVVLLENPTFAKDYPELYFEGVRVLSCTARAAGATPVVLMTWTIDHDAPLRGKIAYRVANGAGAIVSPAGYAWDAASIAGTPSFGLDDTYIAAASLYATLTNRNASAVGYTPPGLSAAAAAIDAGFAYASVTGEAGRTHYDAPYRGVVEVRSIDDSKLVFIDSGTSSEQIWFDRMNEIAPKLGFVPAGTQVPSTNPQKVFDETTLLAATPTLQSADVRLLFARDYALPSVAIAAAGGETDLQVQVWDRHADADPSDGVNAVSMMEYMLTTHYWQAKDQGLALIPYHLMFAKMKTVRPSVQLLADGIHPTYPVGYGLATMSLVSRTGRQPSAAGLDPDTALASTLAGETIRQLASLSGSGEFVPDVPTSPAPHP